MIEVSESSWSSFMKIAVSVYSLVKVLLFDRKILFHVDLFTSDSKIISFDLIRYNYFFVALIRLALCFIGIRILETYKLRTTEASSKDRYNYYFEPLRNKPFRLLSRIPNLYKCICPHFEN